MAPVPKTTIPKLQEDIRKLTERFNAGEMDTTQYVTRLGELENQLQRMYDLSIESPKTTEMEMLQAQTELGRALGGESSAIYAEAAKAAQKNPDSFEGLDELAVQRAQEQLRRRVMPELYKTGEIGTTGGRPAWGLSSIVDPVKGLVLDRETNQVRKATPQEFAVEALKRQVAFSPEFKIKVGPKQEKIEELRRELRAAESKRPRGFTGVSGISPEAAQAMVQAETRRRKRLFDIPREIAKLEQEFEADPEYAIIQEAGYMPETNLGWGFRMLMSGSGTVAPLVKASQDLVGSMTGAKPSIRKGAGYERTEIDSSLGQVLTNIATGQGLFQQTQSQLMPADTKNDGLLGFGTQGTYQSLGMSLAPEFVIPITPAGVATRTAGLTGKAIRGTGQVLKSKPLQRTGQWLSEPTEAFRYQGHKAELNKALKSVDENLSAKKIEREIIKEGGLLSRQTLRAKTAETIGEIFGAIKAIEKAIDTADDLGSKVLKITDIGIPNSPFITNFIGKGLNVDAAVAKIQPLVRQIEKTIDADLPALRRSTDIANDTVKSIRTGQAPKFESDIVNRSIRSALLRNMDWDFLVDNIGKGSEYISRIKSIVQKSQQKGLSPDEIVELGKGLKRIEDSGALNTIGVTAVKQSPRVIYESVREGVSSVLRDNFLKEIPDNFIDIAGTVAVPLNKVVGQTGRSTPGFKQHQKQRARLLESTAELIGKELKYIPTKEGAEALINFQKFTGLQLPQQLLARIEQAATGALKGADAFSGMEWQALENIVSGELAIKFLDGVKLKSGTLTGELATLRGAAREKFISPTKDRGPFAIQLQGMVNAFKQLTNNKMKRVTDVYEQMFAKELLPVPLYRFQKDIQVAQEAAFKQIRTRIEQNVRQATTPEARVQAYNDTIEEYVQMGVQQQVGKGQDKAVRQGLNIEPTLRQQTVGQADALKARQQQQVQQFTQKKQDQFDKIQANKLKQIQKKETLYADRIAKTQTQGAEAVQKLEQSLLENQLKAIKKRYDRRKITLDANYNKTLDKLADILDDNLNKIPFKDPKFVAQNAKIKLKRDKLQARYDTQSKKIEAQYQKKLKEADKKYTPLINDAQNKLSGRNFTPEQKKRIDKKQQDIRNRIARIKTDTDDLLNSLKIKKQDELKKLTDRFDDQLARAREGASQRIIKEEAKQERKSKELSKQRILAQAGEKYGRKNVTNFLKDQGIGDTYDDLMTVIDDLEMNMQQYTNGIYRAKLWEGMIKKIFTKPITKSVKPLRQIEDVNPNIYRDVIRIDMDKPFYDPQNVLAFTPENVGVVIGKMKQQAPYLEPFGLKTLTGEDLNYPLIEMMNDIQRTQNVDKAIKQFMIEQPDMLINLNRMNQGSPGLDNVESMASKLENEIQMMMRMAVNTGKIDKLDVDTLLDLTKEVLFDGVMKDVWTLSGRSKQKQFLNGYLAQMVRTGATNVDMSEYLTNLVSAGVLKTNTFKNVQDKSLRILAKLRDNLDATQALDKQAQALLDDTMQRLPEVIKRLQEEYLLQLVGGAEGKSTGIFGQQLMYLHGYMSRFGLSNDVLIENLKRMKPTIDYLGNTNMGILYGDISGKLVPRILNRFKELAFAEKLQKMATVTRLDSAAYNMLYLLDYLASQFRRLSTANMLYGVGLPTTRFLGFNRLTAPVIFGATLGTGNMQAAKAIKFVGLSATMGLASLAENRLAWFAEKVLKKPKSFKGLFDSTRYLHAPDDEIIIFANKTNSGRNYTAKELRDITDKYGIQYSRASIEFYDQEYKELLDIVGISPDGKVRGRTFGASAKVVDFLNPTKTNMLARVAQVQDAELRQFVFIQSLKEGATVKQAADLAKRSMLDYTSLSSFERQYIARYIYFYAFMRTMGVETLNSFVKGGAAPQVLRAQNNLAQAAAQDVVGYTDDQRGRMFNLFAKTVDERDVYLSGPPNPLMQMFDLMSTSALLSMNVVSDTNNKDMLYEDILFDSILTSGLKLAESNPVIDTLFEWIRVGAQGKRIRQFPSELIFAAEQQGMLDEVIEMYDLVPMNYISAGRPLTRGIDGEPGKYYTFRKGKLGNKGYTKYLKHRLIGMATFTIGVQSAIQKTGYYGAMTRNWRDYYKAQMLSVPSGIRVPTFDKEGRPVGQRTIPTTSRYLKGSNVDSMRDGLWSAYMLGIITPTRAKDKNKVIMNNLNDALRVLRDYEKAAQ